MHVIALLFLKVRYIASKDEQMKILNVCHVDPTALVIWELKRL